MLFYFKKNYVLYKKEIDPGIKLARMLINTWMKRANFYLLRICVSINRKRVEILEIGRPVPKLIYEIWIKLYFYVNVN